MDLRMFDVNEVWPALFVVCLLLHLIADFNLQDKLGEWKQKKKWNALVSQEFGMYYEKMRKLFGKDWVACLIVHGFMWSALTFLPLMLLNNYPAHFQQKAFFATVVLNSAVHCWIDHLKCNEYKISLVQDQMIHFCQVAATLLAWVLLARAV